MKVLVTGANGYIGSFVVKELLALGCDVLAVDLDFSEVDPLAKRIQMSVLET